MLTSNNYSTIFQLLLGKLITYFEHLVGPTFLGLSSIQVTPVQSCRNTEGIVYVGCTKYFLYVLTTKQKDLREKLTMKVIKVLTVFGVGRGRIRRERGKCAVWSNGSL